MAKNFVLALMCGVVAMTVLDLSVVNVALPSIQASLHARPADLQRFLGEGSSKYVQRSIFR